MEKLFEGEYRLMEVLWDAGEVNSTRLVELCRERLGWNKSTTYTVLRKLKHKGAVRHENTVAAPLWTREQVVREEGEELAAKAGGGVPLPHRLPQRAEADPAGGGGAQAPHRRENGGGVGGVIAGRCAVGVYLLLPQHGAVSESGRRRDDPAAAGDQPPAHPGPAAVPVGVGVAGGLCLDIHGPAGPHSPSPSACGSWSPPGPAVLCRRIFPPFFR